MAKSKLEERLEAIERKEAISEGISHGIKLRCAFVWSGVTLFFGIAGAWASDNVEPLKAGLKAFWNVWRQKW